MTINSREQWRQIVAGCSSRDPRISKLQWCETNGISFRRLMYWQRKFRLEALEQREDSIHADLLAGTNHTSAQAFVDVTPQYKAMQTNPPIDPARTETVSFAPELVILAGPYRICVSGSVQTATLEHVLRAIRHA